jgi:peptidoglycan-N-acetylglucosamine deacetylase
VIPGRDTPEATKVVRRALAPSGLPKALQYVQYAGKPGVQRVTVGEQSGEVVARTTVTPAVPAHRATGKVIALTFDDGPNATYTPQILAILKAKHVTATFCQVGTEVQRHPELSRQILEAGHQLCNHTLHHVEGLEKQPITTIHAEIAGGAKAITDATGKAPRFYRPPGGSLAPVIYQETARQGEVVLYWSIDPRDWKRPPPQEIVTNVVNQLTPGGIILLHDGGGNRDNTVDALPGIIDYVRALGYTFTPPITTRSQVG